MSESRLSAVGAAAVRVLRALRWLLPALCALLLYLILPHFPQVTETVFSRGLFRGLNAVLGGAVGLLPFSLTELAAVLALPALIAVVVWRIVRYRRGKRGGRFWRGIAWTLSSLLLLYMLMHGVNFYRQPASELMQLGAASRDPKQLQTLSMYLARQASAARELLPEDADGVAVPELTLSEILTSAGEGYDLLEETYPFLHGTTHRVKPVQLSHWWSYTGITGMYFPMLAEANVNIDVPLFSVPATAAHELAHTRGFAREDECNFFACLSCFSHPSPGFRYSGYVLAYIHCANALYDYNPELWKEAYACCSEGMRRDLRAQNAYWDQFKGKVEEISSSVNNGFLQAQGSAEGVLSYNRVVELLLAYYGQGGME